MTSCTCQPNDFPDTDCPKHGLYGDVKFPPMDRHAQETREVVGKCPFCFGLSDEGVALCRCCGGTQQATRVRKETAAEVQQRLYREAHRSDAA